MNGCDEVLDPAGLGVEHAVESQSSAPAAV